MATKSPSVLVLEIDVDVEYYVLQRAQCSVQWRTLWLRKRR
jgi:hypothetical protein